MGNRYQPRRLSDYIERAYTPDRNQRAAQTMPRKPFIDDNSDDQPMLKRPGVNRILLFPGSFNPPHKGHAELLRYVFEHARDELNIVACIIIMTNEERLEEKTSEEANPLILTRNQRISLWRGAGIPLTRTWIYNKSQAEWAQFRSRLTRNIKRDQIDVKFIILTGPDCIGHTGASDPKQWNCREAITSDVSRATDYRGDNSMRQISAHTPWKKVEVDRYGLSDSIRARLNDKSSAASKNSLQSP